MSLAFGQLIYTSFPETGFQVVTSAKISEETKHFFLTEIVHQYWDAYNPPQAGYQAIYLCQRTLEDNLFGWLYNFGQDDFGRSDIPYFLCYHLGEKITSPLLNRIFNGLQKGPLQLIDRHKFHFSDRPVIENILIPDNWHYQAATPGLAISEDWQQQIYQSLKKQQLIRLFLPSTEQKIVTNKTSDRHLTNNRSSRERKKQIMKIANIDKIDTILQDLVFQKLGIQSAALMSFEGQLLTKAIGIEENSVLSLAGIMLYLAESAEYEFNWQQTRKISLNSLEGNMILVACDPNIFIFLRTDVLLDDLLEKQIDRLINVIQKELKLR